jgi:hypothetical protein
MDKDFVNYEIALALKELGFDEPCYIFYYGDRLVLALNLEQGDTNTKLQKLHPNYVTVPLKQQVFRWFREKWKLHVEIVVQLGFKHWNAHILPSGEWLKKPTPTGFNTYEEVENACIDKLIELAKQR